MDFVTHHSLDHLKLEIALHQSKPALYMTIKLSKLLSKCHLYLQPRL